MKEIITIILEIVKDPASFELKKAVYEDRIMSALHKFADDRPPKLEDMIQMLQETYPGLEKNVFLIEKGDELRKEMMEKLFTADLTDGDLKLYETKIAMFAKLLDFNNLITRLVQNATGMEVVGKKLKNVPLESHDNQGAAQKILKQNGEK